MVIRNRKIFKLFDSCDKEEAMNDGLPSRLCALNSLNAVFDKGQALDQALDKYALKLNLSPQDKSFAHALCGLVLRHKPNLQTMINSATDRKRDIDPLALNTVLLIGAAQIYFMHVPDHAAVDTSVDLSVKIKCPKQKGLVNAVLRRLICEKETHPIHPSLPQWIRKSWETDYGEEEALHLEQSSLQQAKIGLSDKDGQWHIVDSPNTLPNLTPDQWVQDFASHYPVSLMNDLTGCHVFDLCAAPGGKTMQLAAKGAHVTSVDISASRLRRLQENLDRTNLGSHVKTICADLLKWNPNHQADIVLLDAPCSATGTIRRHPDLPYIRGEKDIQALVALQKQILDRAKGWAKPGGLLIYCTCSLQKIEGEAHIENFLNHNSEFQRATPDAVNPKYLTADGDIRLLPTYGDMDGFFISFLKKS